jgi:NADH-quinone oxidoreductase subunit I
MPLTASEYVGNIRHTVKSFWEGMSVTLSQVLRRPITIQYPDRTDVPVQDQLPPRYRGFLEVDAAICTGCQACERACPISCIQIQLDKDPANPKQRVVSQFDIDEAKCMFCGLCVEPCPTGAIQHTREFEATQRSVRNLVFRWADPLAPFPVYKVQKGADYFPRAPLGSLVREVIATRSWDAAGPAYLPPEPLKPPPPPAPKPAPAAKPAGAAPAPGAAPAGAAAAKPAATAAPSLAAAATPAPAAAPGATAPAAPAAHAASDKPAPPAPASPPSGEPKP